MAGFIDRSAAQVCDLAAVGDDNFAAVLADPKCIVDVVEAAGECLVDVTDLVEARSREQI